MEICTQLETQLAPSLDALGYEIVRISLQGGDVKTVQVMAERKDYANMTLADCEKNQPHGFCPLGCRRSFSGKIYVRNIVSGH